MKMGKQRLGQVHAVIQGDRPSLHLSQALQFIGLNAGQMLSDLIACSPKSQTDNRAVSHQRIGSHRTAFYQPEVLRIGGERLPTLE
ncbi:hypothetical protein O77CONTIG1_03932 [Leptolyngbya sp. O-77]|nr:hypothetical protein O77CONTIG1_03932 [Leptolyngbya sp. O-77]